MKTERRQRAQSFLLLSLLLASFLLIPPVLGQQLQPTVRLLQEQPEVGTEITFWFEGAVDGVSLQTPTTVYRHLGAPDNPLSFTPEESGEYQVLLLSNGTSEVALTFTVDKPGSVEQPLAVETLSPPVVGKQVSMRIRDAAGNEKALSAHLSEEHGRERLQLSSSVGDFTFNGLKGDRAFRLDKPPREHLRLRGKRITDTYSFDPSSLNFTNGTLRRRATGNELYKCKEWDFDSQDCLGIWVKVMDLSPGMEYQLTISPEDPGFVETGVATVNSIKPIYESGESAELLMAVLDTAGYLVSGADVRLEIRRPDNATFILSTMAGTITEKSKGIYAAVFNNTQVAGNYSLFVEAIAPGVNMSMVSSFLVKDEYLFDILRDVPMSIDPWRGSFESMIRVENHDANETSITVVEELPLNFTITDRGNASLSFSNSSQQLTWVGALLGFNLTYRVQVPFIAPDLYTLGRITVLSTAGNQVEARPWFLAIDPAETLVPIVNASTALQGTSLTTGQVSDITNDDTTYVTFTKNQVLTVELSDPTNTTEIVSVENLECNVTYTSQSYSPAATFSVYDAIGANVLGSTTLPASSSLDNTISLSNLQNSPNFDIADLFTLNIYIKNNDGGRPQTISIDRVWCAVSYTTRDVVPPNVSLNTPSANAYFNTTSVTFNYTASDDREIANCSLYIDGSLNATNTTPVVNGSWNTFTSTIAEGQHNWTVACVDGFDNTGWAPETRIFTVDLTPPTTFNLSSPGNDTVSTDLTPTFQWQATTESNFNNYTLLVDDDPSFGSPNYVKNTYNSVTNTTYTFTTVIASNKKYYWKVIAADEAGWTTESATSWIYITDTLLPSAFNLVAPSNGALTNNTTPFLDWSSTTEINFANYTILFDDDPGFGSVDHTYYAFNLPSNSSYQIGGGEALGANTLWYWKVIAYDRAGQSRNSTSTFNYTADTLAPNITLEAPSPGYVELFTNTLDFNYSVVDTLSTVASCRLIVNGTEEQTHLSVPEGSTQTFEQYLDNGYYEWWVNCTDGVGNENESTHRFLTVNVTVDITPPSITLYDPEPASYLNLSTVIFNYTVSDATGIENCSLYLDGSFNTTNTTPVLNGAFNTFIIPGVTEGFHDWFVNCVDNSTTNNAANSSSRNFTIDLTLPTAVTLFDPANETKTNNPSITFNWSQTTESHFANYTILVDNNSDFSSPDHSYATYALGTTEYTSGAIADGLYYWKVISYDLAGNSQESTQTWQFQIHTQAPEFLNVTEYPLDPVEYNPFRLYNFTLFLQEPELDTVFFTHDFSGAIQNSTPSWNGSHYYYEIGGLTPDTYSYSWFANDTFGNENTTVDYSYIVTKNTTTMTLELDGLSDNLTINESVIVNLTGNLDWPAAGLVSIRKNGSLLVQNTSIATTLHNFTTPGLYIINASYPGSSNYYASWDAWYVTVLDAYAPTVTLTSPGNDTTDTDGLVSYGYKVTDTSPIDNCTLYIDGVNNGTTYSPARDTTIYFNRDYDTNQNLTWQVRCYDVAGRQGNSSIYNLSIQLSRYDVTLVAYECNEETNGGACLTADVNQSDGTYDSHGKLVKTPGNNYVNVTLENASIPPGATILNVTVYWEKYQQADNTEGAFYLYWQNGSSWDLICTQTFTASSEATPDDVTCNMSALPSWQEFNDGIVLRADFNYQGTSANNAYGSDFIGLDLTYEEDTTPPSVELNDPPNGQERGAGDIAFNFTASDVNLYNCTLYGDFNGSWDQNQTINLSTGLSSGVKSSFLPIYLNPGYYNWNVLCFDIANNSAFAGENYSVNITPPDLTTYRNVIILNDSTYKEGTNVTINATIFNEGYTTAEDFLIQFWKGDPDAGGMQIGTNRSIASLVGFANTSVNVTYVMLPGPNRIFVVVDPDDRIIEVSETNNEANRTFNVDAYHTYYGSVRANVTLDTQFNETLKNFAANNASGNLFYIRTGSDVDFSAFKALGRTLGDLQTTDDFSDADTLLNMSEYNDSINVRWANNTDIPLTTTSFEVREAVITNVPVINSDVSGNFTTGILWDTSKDNSSNTEYDTSDKEPIIFITHINQDTGSAYGIEDYVAEIPAPLRSYAGQPSSTISIYYELI